MNSSALSAQCQPISNVMKSSHNNEHIERPEPKNRNRTQHQNAWTYISNRILGMIQKTFKKGIPKTSLIP